MIVQNASVMHVIVTEKVYWRWSKIESSLPIYVYFLTIVMQSIGSSYPSAWILYGYIGNLLYLMMLLKTYLRHGHAL